MFTNNHNLISYIYFILTGIINLYFAEYNFVLHHLICINIIFISNYNTDLDFGIWISKCYLAEIYNIFLSMKNILIHIEKRNLITNTMLIKKLKNANNILFVLTYFVFRMIYILPQTFAYMYANYFSIQRTAYFEFALLNILLMSILNIYWSYLIFKKVFTQRNTYLKNK